jgi:hypothetical protein
MVSCFLSCTLHSFLFVDFELSDAQYMHAIAVEHLVPSLPDLKVQICSTDMSEACFWKIYFVLLHSKLSKQDAELLSTPQVILILESSTLFLLWDGTLFFFYFVVDFVQVVYFCVE